MPGFKQDVKDLVYVMENRLLEMEIKFISPHNVPTAPPSTYAVDVQSYAVLCHAAFEEFAESLCLRVLEEVEDSWINKKQFSKATLCLLHFDLDSTSHNIERWTNISRYYDFIKDERVLCTYFITT